MMGTETTTQQVSKNWQAWASVGCALLACVPPGAVFAIVFGVGGLRAARANNNRGRGPSILGICGGVLGVVSFGWFMYVSFAYAGSTRAFVRSFLGDVEASNLAAARLKCDGTIPSGDVSKLADQLNQLGPVRDLSFTSPMYQSWPDGRGFSGMYLTLSATMNVTGGQRELDVALVRDAAVAGGYRMHRFVLRNPAAHAAAVQH
jgi:hypothetical protein